LSASEEIRDARVIAAMCSPVHGKVASMSTAYQDFQMDLQRGQRTIYLEFPKLPLLIGAYHFNISLYGSKETDFYQRRTIQGNFRIVGPPLLSDGRGLGGIFKLPHRWGSD
jgi:lipopolysaccharide transport system ATP-binding protein